MLLRPGAHDTVVVDRAQLATNRLFVKPDHRHAGCCARDIGQAGRYQVRARRLIPNMGLPPTGAAADHISKAAATDLNRTE